MNSLQFIVTAVLSHRAQEWLRECKVSGFERDPIVRRIRSEK